MTQEIEVLYNVSCPICSREVDHYAKLSGQAGLPIHYADCSDTVQLTDWGVTADIAAKRFHVRQTGQIISGLPAFIILWQEIPQTRWLATIFNIPGLHWIAAKVYDNIAAPALFSMHKRRMRKRLPSAASEL